MSKVHDDHETSGEFCGPECGCVPPGLFMGGQGRCAEDVRDSGRVVGMVVLAAFYLTVGFFAGAVLL